MPPPGKFKGCGRGIFALESWDPPARPADLEDKFAQMQSNLKNDKSRIKKDITNGSSSNNSSQEKASSGQPEKAQEKSVANKTNSPTDVPKVGQQMMAKYNYKANPASPLGGPELNLKQGDQLKFVGAHDDHWWIAENTSGQKGFIPASYVVPVEEKVSSLPWLKNKEPEPDTTCAFGAPANGKPVVKPYVPTYKHEGLAEVKDTSVKQYFCDVCQKQLNGPMPYKAHMASKAHKEEVEIAEAYNS